MGSVGAREGSNALCRKALPNKRRKTCERYLSAMPWNCVPESARWSKGGKFLKESTFFTNLNFRFKGPIVIEWVPVLSTLVSSIWTHPKTAAFKASTVPYCCATARRCRDNILRKVSRGDIGEITLFSTERCEICTHSYMYLYTVLQHWDPEDLWGERWGKGRKKPWGVESYMHSHIARLILTNKRWPGNLHDV